jgi:hypothetical protein
MTAWDTEPEHVDAFVRDIRAALAAEHVAVPV